MPRYLLSVHGPAERTESGTYPSQEAMLQAFTGTCAFNERLHKDGHFIFSGGLEPATTATAVDGQGEKPAFTDGPYLETQECLGGFWIIGAADLDVVLALQPTNPYERCRSRDRSRRRAGDHPCPPPGAGAGGLRPRAPLRRPRRRRGSRGRGVRSGCGAVAARGCTAQSRRLARHHRDPQGDRLAPSRVAARRQTPGGPTRVRRHPS